jgi:release factor glutamine methyltransferase
MKSVLEVIKATAAYFEKAGVENARLNIEHLLAHVLGKKQRMELYLEFDRPLSEKELGPLRELVRRRAAGEPLQHLLGNVEFLGRQFKTDARALIPRPETELLAQKILDRHASPPARLADVGTGSGVLALTLAANWEETEVHAVDVSPAALELAAENARDLALQQRVLFHRGSLMDPLSGAFGLVVANLPYVPASEIPGLSREVRHDPVLALDGGPDGSELIRVLITQARNFLKGLLALEIGHDQSAPLAEALSLAGYHSISPETDDSGRNRFLFASYG